MKKSAAEICWEHGCRPAVAEAAVKAGAEPERLDSADDVNAVPRRDDNITMLWRIGGKEILDTPNGPVWQGTRGFAAAKRSLGFDSARPHERNDWTPHDRLSEIVNGGFGYFLEVAAVFDASRHGNITAKLGALLDLGPDDYFGGDTDDDNATDYMVSWNFWDRRGAEKAFLALAADDRVDAVHLTFEFVSNVGEIVDSVPIAKFPTQAGTEIVRRALRDGWEPPALEDRDTVGQVRMRESILSEIGQGKQGGEP